MQPCGPTSALLGPAALEWDPWRLTSTHVWKEPLQQEARGQPCERSAEWSLRLPTRPAPAPAREMAVAAVIRVQTEASRCLGVRNGHLYVQTTFFCKAHAHSY